MKEASKSQEVTEDKLIEYTDTMVRIYRYIIDAILVDICTVEVRKTDTLFVIYFGAFHQTFMK